VLREDVYFCLCCHTLRDSNHKKVSDRYCMQCGKKSNKPTKKIKRADEYTQLCESCFQWALNEFEKEFGFKPQM